MAGCEAHEDSICACECVVHLFIQKAWMWSGSPALFGQVAHNHSSVPCQSPKVDQNLALC